MAASPLDERRAAPTAVAAALLAAALATAAAPAAEPRTRELPISLDAASSELDYQTDVVVFHDVVISQGELRVSAREAQATGLNFENSRWTFRGAVRIEAEGGTLTAEEAVVSFVDNAIASAIVTGGPAAFEQPLENTATMARGRAVSIQYDVGAGTVRLEKDAWLSDGRSEIRGELLVYDIRAQRVQAAAPRGSDERVHITIRPRGTSEPRERGP